jgi:hypothetical protein
VPRGIRSVAGAVLALAALGPPTPAGAIPVFARQYGVTCRKCHSVIPRLNEFGAAFLDSGDRIPGVRPGATLPFSAKLNTIGSSENQGSGPEGAGLPREIVDEVEAFVAGGIGGRASYFAEQYVVDGGLPGQTRDAWVTDRLNPWEARIPLCAQAGSFSLPLPVDPETFRESYAGYTLFEQTAGSNPFNFFDPKIGVRVSAGNALRGTSVQLVAAQGHDRQSGLPATGTDLMALGQQTLGPLTLSLYRYTGTRPVANLPDRFERTGLGVVFNDWKRWTSETVLQTGWDSNCGAAAGGGCASSGGFTQVRYAFNRRLFALGRYEGTSDSTGAFTRDGLLLAGYAPVENARVTIEDVIRHAPATTNTVNVQFTVAF